MVSSPAAVLGPPRGDTCYCLIVKYVAVLVLAVFVPLGCRGSDSGWTLVRSPHFQVYSELGEHDGRSIAVTLEQLRAFFFTSGSFHGTITSPGAAH